jgi:hypothetical protein
MFGIFLVIPDYSESIDSIPEKAAAQDRSRQYDVFNYRKIWQSREIVIIFVIFYDAIKIQQSLWSIFGK